MTGRSSARNARLARADLAQTTSRFPSRNAQARRLIVYLPVVNILLIQLKKISEMQQQHPSPRNPIGKAAPAPDRTHKPAGTWQSIAEQASQERDPDRLAELVQELSCALEEYLKPRKQS